MVNRFRSLPASSSTSKSRHNNCVEGTRLSLGDFVRVAYTLLAGTAGVDAWLWWGEPSLSIYCGLSGILNSLLIVGLLHLWCDFHHPMVLVTVVGAALKIILEIYIGQALLTQTAWPSVPTAHAAGFLCGLIMAWRIKKGSESTLTPFDSYNGRGKRGAYHETIYRNCTVDPVG